jgi:hypothetical protein
MRPCDGAAGAAEALAAERRRFEGITELYRGLGRDFQGRMAAEAGGGDGGAGAGGLQLMGSACQGCKPYPRPECVDEAAGTAA